MNLDPKKAHTTVGTKGRLKPGVQKAVPAPEKKAAAATPPPILTPKPRIATTEKAEKTAKKVTPKSRSRKGAFSRRKSSKKADNDQE
jgi:hypothetical protein